MKRIRFNYILFFLFITSVAGAQSVMTVGDAVKLALKNSFDIQVAANDAGIARTNNTPGNAGMLPVVALTGSGTVGQSNVYQKLTGGAENNYPALSTTALSAGVQLSWTLFDGGKMFVTKNKLNEIENLGQLRFRDKVLTTLYDVISAYYNIIRQKQQLASMQEMLSYNNERVKIAEAGVKSGSLLKTDMLQARMDMNVTRETIINQDFEIEAAKKNLNQLLGRNSESEFEVSDSILSTYSPDKQTLLSKLNTSNTGILSLQKQTEIARLSLKENERNYLPVLNFKGGYYFSQTLNSAGSTLNNRSAGPQAGATLTVPLYNAGETKRKINVSKLELQSSELDLEQLKLAAQTTLQNAFKDFENQQRLLEIEKQNNELAKENISISMQRLRQGQATSLEVHQAQQEFVQSCTRLIDFRYNLKMAETKLKQLVADL